MLMSSTNSALSAYGSLSSSSPSSCSFDTVLWPYEGALDSNHSSLTKVPT